MTTTLTSADEQIEQLLLEEGNSKSAVTRRFNKMAGLFSQSAKSPWDYTLKTNDQKRLAYAGFLLSKFGGSIPTDKRNKTGAEVLFSMSDLGRVTSALEKALKADGATFASVKTAYEKAVARLEATALRNSKAKVASGDATKALFERMADKAEEHSANFVRTTEADDFVARLKAAIAKYEATPLTKVVAIQQSEPELINA